MAKHQRSKTNCEIVANLKSKSYLLAKFIRMGVPAGVDAPPLTL